MPTVVPLLVVIGIRVGPGGRREADHPNWALVLLPPPADRLSGDGTQREDFTLGSWHYDKCCGHDTVPPDSPLNTQRGVRLVTPEFAANALVVFPATMSILTEAQWEAFYDNHVRGHMPENRVNIEALNALKVELDLRTALASPAPVLAALRAKIAKALDPDDAEPGIRADPLRRWASFKTAQSIVIPP